MRSSVRCKSPTYASHKTCSTGFLGHSDQPSPATSADDLLSSTASRLDITMLTEQYVRECFSYLENHDGAAFFAIFDDNIKWVSTGPANPVGGTYLGKAN